MRIASLAGRPLAVCLLVLSGLVGANGPASAFDRFERLLPALAASTGGMNYDEIFRYIGFGDEPPSVYFKSGKSIFGSGVDTIDKALADPQEASALTGMRFDQVLGVLVQGRPPGDSIILLGAKGFASGAPAALESRGFQRTSVGGVSMLALGEDFSIDLKRRNRADPFGRSMGASQRIVVLDEFVVASRGSVYAATAAAPLARPITCVTCKTIATVAEGIRLAAGPRAQIRAASAYGARAFLAADDPATALTDKSGAPVDPAELKRRLDATKAARTRLPVFGIALFAHTSGENGQALHIALSYLDQGAAEQAARAIAERLGAKTWGTTSGAVARGVQLPAGVAIKTSIASVGPGFAGVVTVTHPGEPQDAAAREFSLWHHMIMNRDFWPLQILE